MVSDLLKMTKVLTLNVIRKITEATVFVEILPKDVLHKFYIRFPEMETRGVEWLVKDD